MKQKSAQLDPIFNQHAEEVARRDREDTLKLDRQFAVLCAGFQFDQAKVATGAVPVETPGATKEKEALLRKADWLRQFKATLISDINTAGYSAPLASRTGAVPAGPKRATEEGLELRTSFGTVAIPWSALPPNAWMTMAAALANRNLTPEQVADRQWLSGVFACEEDMAHDGRALLLQASQVKDAYKDQLALFMDGG